jgi:hypothetical protein
MADAVNPYASPVEINQVAEDPASTVLRKLRGPAMGLLLLSAMTGPNVLLIPLLPIILLVFLLNEPLHIVPLQILGALAFFAMSVSNCFILAGAWNMRQGTRYKLAYRAAVLSCIPILSASGYLGIPFGIWALLVLRRRDVREAFKT